PWLIINKTTPDKHPWITKDEQLHILSDQTTSENSPGIKVYKWKELLDFKKTWSIILSRFFIDLVWWLFVTWLLTFLKEQFQFDIKQVGAFAWVPYLFAALGGMLGGFYSSWLIRRGTEAAAAG